MLGPLLFFVQSITTKVRISDNLPQRSIKSTNVLVRSFCAFCAFLGLAFFGDAVVAQKVLRWGADPSGGAPYVFTDPANPDRYIGYEKERVDALAQAMGRRGADVLRDWE